MTDVFLDLVAEAPIPPRGILSQTLSDEAGVELVLFAFAAGERLSEHTAARPAILHVLSGHARISVAGQELEAGANTWIRMAERTAHSVEAMTPLVMALYLLPPG